jgi:hypothetical protein
LKDLFTRTGGDAGGKSIKTREGKLMGSSYISGGVFGRREIEESFSIPPLARCRSLDVARMRSCDAGWLWLPGMTKRNCSSRRAGSVLLVSVFSSQILPGR